MMLGCGGGASAASVGTNHRHRCCPCCLCLLQCGKAGDRFLSTLCGASFPFPFREEETATAGNLTGLVTPGN